MYPWQSASWQLLMNRLLQGNLPHALLIHGPVGAGKSSFAEQLLQRLCCEQYTAMPPDEVACRVCPACQQFAADSHPDITRLSAKEGENSIKIDAVRHMIDWLQVTPQYAGFKVALLSDADLLTRGAANSLLKTLEEPASSDLIILTTSSPAELPVTVRSRCQSIDLGHYEHTLAEQWLSEQGIDDSASALRLASGGPLAALAAMDEEQRKSRELLFGAWHNVLLGKASIARSVEALAALPVRLCLRHFMGWTADCVKLQINAEAPITDNARRPALLKLSTVLDTETWFKIYDELLHLYQIDSASFKTPTVLEGVFADIRLKIGQ